MKHICWTAMLALMAATPEFGTAQTAEQPEETEIAAEDAVPMRPDDQNGEMNPSDGLAECASILAVASSASNNFVQRNNMENAAGVWFAASGDMASTEGEIPGAEVWEAKVENWAGQIGSIDSMASYPEWMAYCAHVGAENGLDTSHFPTVTQ